MPKKPTLTLRIMQGRQSARKMPRSSPRPLVIRGSEFVGVLRALPTVAQAVVKVTVEGHETSLPSSVRASARILERIERDPAAEYTIISALHSGSAVFLGVPDDRSSLPLVSFKIGGDDVTPRGRRATWKSVLQALAAARRATRGIREEIVAFTHDIEIGLAKDLDVSIVQCNGIYGPKLPSIHRPKPRPERPSGAEAQPKKEGGET